jgi:DNA repair exonuclease SbcCD ATPase subunit
MKEIDHILEIEKVKKEADKLMMNKLKEIEVLKTKVRNAETETALIKATGMNSPEMNAAKEEIEELKNKIADLEESLKSKDYWRDPDYKFLIEENLNLRRRITELEQEILEVKADNMKMARQVEDKIDKLRKSGM